MNWILKVASQFSKNLHSTLKVYVFGRDEGIQYLNQRLKEMVELFLLKTKISLFSYIEWPILSMQLVF